MAVPEIRWIVFDLGNVLVDLASGGTERLSKSLGIETEELHSFLLEVDASRRLCTGEFQADQFTAMLNRRFGGSVTPQAITALFGPEIAAVYPAIPAIVESLAGRYSLGVLSNTFFGHWDYFIATDLAKSFSALMASHLMGCVKPDPLIYQKALAQIAAAPEETLFVDDREENVAGARAAGMHSFQSLSPDETVRGLMELGIAVNGK
ncbi:MAG: HAD family phosphatase [bacterium]